jgi:hypothetical protein
MDFIAVGNRNTPYIDGQCYKKMCFVCFHAPQDEIQHYDKQGSVSSIEGPFYDHKHIKTAQELVEAGTAETLLEAKKSISGVRRKIKEAGIKKLNKLKLKRPKAEYEFNPEAQEPKISKAKKSNRRIRR